MSLRFVLGRAGSGKSTFCLDSIRTELQQTQQGSPLILIVPEQATYQTELALAGTSDLPGILRAQVFSFQRLGWRVFSETGGKTGVTIGELGKRMLLRRIFLQRRSEFKVLAKSVKRPGMADALAQIIGEFKTYRLSPQNLLDLTETGLDKNLTEKLKDLALIYSEFEKLLSRGLIDPDNELSYLAEKISSAKSLYTSQVWVDGFKGFTPQELQILEEILTICPEVTITLPLEPEFLQNSKEIRKQILPGQEMYLTAWQTYQDLLKISYLKNIPVLEPLFLSEPKRFRNSWLKHLEKYFFNYPAPELPVSSDEKNVLNPPGIRLMAAVNRRNEVEGVAAELRKLARDEGFRWQEMAIMTRDLGSYAQLILDTFKAFEIPHFLDYKRTIMHHPLMEFLLSVLEIARTQWSFEAVFRCLKTDFFSFSRDEVDRLENYCLAFGIQGQSWVKKEDWKYLPKMAFREHDSTKIDTIKDTIKQEINRIRRTVTGYLVSFVEHVTSSDILQVRFIASEIYDLLERMNIPGKLQYWSDIAETEGDLDEALLQRQIWEGVISVLDEMVSGLGEEYLSLEDFSLILTSGLESLQLGLIPPGLDQVLVGSLDRSRNPEVKVLFLLGVNDGILPARLTENGILDISERKVLKEMGVELAPSGTERLGDEQYYIYTGLTRATERLYVCYSLTDQEGKVLAPSTVVRRLKSLFPTLIEEIWDSRVYDLEQVSHPGPLFQAYSLRLEEKRRGSELSPLWLAIRQWFSQDPVKTELLKFVETGLSIPSKEQNLQEPLTRNLYGKKFKVSVSRLEQFNRCPFAHFARYGLRLQERKKFNLASPDLGQFFHRLLHDFAFTLRQTGKEWGKLSKDESWHILSELTDRIAPEFQNEILLSNARYRYLTRKIKRTVHSAIRVLAEHSRRGKFIPISLELKFGDQGFPAVTIPLVDGESLVLVGQIDRIDAAYLNGEVYLRIFDYKSQPLSLSLDKVYYGLSLQLLTYLDAALNGAEILVKQAENLLGIPTDSNPNILPAGFLYFPIIEPQLESTVPLTSEELDGKRIKAIRVDGYLLGHTKVLEAMDQEFVNGQSNLLNLRLTKDKKFRQGSKVLTSQQFTILRNHLHNVLKETGERILRGDISVNPFKMGKLNGCEYCIYNSVCHFEEGIGCSYRNLPSLNANEVWTKLDLGQIMEETQSEKVNERKAFDSKYELNWLEEQSETGEGGTEYGTRKMDS